MGNVNRIHVGSSPTPSEVFALVLDHAMVLRDAQADVWVVDVWEAGVDHWALVASVWVAGDPPPAAALADEVTGWRPTVLILSGSEAHAFA